jgi:hypothetical protein
MRAEPSFELWQTIAADAAAESPLWADALLPEDERLLIAVFSPLAPPELAVGLETIYEGYLAHYGTPRLFAPRDADTALLLGDYLYAHGLVRISATGNVAAVADLAELISLCAQARAEERAGEEVAWVATATLIGAGALEDARVALRLEGDPGPLEQAARAVAGDEGIDRALAAHARLVR